MPIPRRSGTPPVRRRAAGQVRHGLEELYLRRLHRELEGAPRPHHLGLVMDEGPRGRHADDVVRRHRVAADRLDALLGWCQHDGVDHVTVYALSADTLARADEAEQSGLTGLLETVVLPRLVLPGEPWALEVVGALERLPASTVRAARRAVDATRGRPASLTLALAYDVHPELGDAVRHLLREAVCHGTGLEVLAERLDEAELDEHVVAPVCEMDLVIRTGGAQRLVDVFPWRPREHTVFVHDVPLPAFSEREFLRALRTWARRQASV